MKRRAMAAEGVSVGVFPIAGCISSGVKQGLAVVETDSEIVGSSVEINVEVRNSVSERRSGTVRCRLEIEEGQEYEQVQEISVAAERTDTFTCRFTPTSSVQGVRYESATKIISYQRRWPMTRRAL